LPEIEFCSQHPRSAAYDHCPGDVGVLEEIAPGRQAVAKVALHPRIAWAGAAPGKEELERLHHEAHQICFIANSVKTRVTIE